MGQTSYGEGTLHYSASMQGSNGRFNHVAVETTTQGNNTNRVLQNFLTESGVSPNSTAQKRYRNLMENGGSIKEEPWIDSNR